MMWGKLQRAAAGFSPQSRLDVGNDAFQF